jgi:uncharacterized protein YceH (UPF0502 family)
MSSEAPAGPVAWPVLDMQERRILGTLVEKQKTTKTADTYPLSLNALVTGCNQKSNRDPVLNLTDDEVEEALARCQKKQLVVKITGGRVVRWRHLLYETWHVDKVELAILAELLLRGPQTEGELRTRVNRMDAIDDLDVLRAALRPLVQRNLVLYLTPEGRGAVVTHGFHDQRELERIRAHVNSQPVSVAVAPEPVAGAPRMSHVEEELATTRAELTALKQVVAEVQDATARLEGELRALKEALGVQG